MKHYSPVVEYSDFEIWRKNALRGFGLSLKYHEKERKHVCFETLSLRFVGTFFEAIPYGYIRRLV